MLNRELFTKNMIAIGEMFGKPLSKELFKMYYMVLGDMTDEQFKQAVGQIMRTHKWNTLPKPAEFIEAITVDKDAAMIQAWQKVEVAMSRVGAYQTIVFDDPLIHGFIQGIESGWPGLCSKTHDELVWVRKDFERYYKAIKPESITCKPLVGLSESANINSGHEHRELPYYAGDKAKCEALLEHKPVAKLIENIAKQLEG